MPRSTKVTDKREFVNLGLYGPGGTGKTSNLATLANLGPTLFVDVEAGIKRRPLELLGINVNNIELWDYERPLTFNQLEDLFDELLRELDSDPEAWAGVVIDSGTQTYEALVQESVAYRVPRNKNHPQKSDPMFIDRDDWGRANGEYRRLLRRFCADLPCHFGASYLSRRDKDAHTGEVHIGPAVSPGLQPDVIGWPDIVGRCWVDQEGEAFLGTFRPEGVKEGKDRFSALPTPMVDPTFERIVKYVYDELDFDSDPVQAAWGLAAVDEDEGGDDDEAEPVATKPVVRAPARPRPRPKKKAAAGRR
jgi:hypothetical protein